MMDLEFDCSDKLDGQYPLGCSRDFITCNHGETSRMSCPGKLVFDPLTGHCLEKVDSYQLDLF